MRPEIYVMGKPSSNEQRAKLWKTHKKLKFGYSLAKV